MIGVLTLAPIAVAEALARPLAIKWPLPPDQASARFRPLLQLRRGDYPPRPHRARQIAVRRAQKMREGRERIHISAKFTIETDYDWLLLG
jgi:hypothetical protein